MITAEEFLRENNDEDFRLSKSGFYLSEMMIEFAKLHVEAALKEALESIPCLGSSSDIASYEEVEKEVLNAYPLENIK
jgi:hypothetical protein